MRVGNDTKTTSAKKGSSRRGTPRKKCAAPKREARREDVAHVAANGAPERRPLLPKVVLALVVVAAVCAGGFALWKVVGTQAEEQAPEEKAVNTVQLDSQDESRVGRLMDELTLEQKVAQLFVVTPEALTNVGVAIAAGDATREALSKYPVGGLVYFAANLQNPTQTAEMLRSTQNYAKDTCGLPLFTCVDEEGGTVTRVACNNMFEVTDVGNMAKIGAAGDVEQARDAANIMGTYLDELGFNVDFAPVADVVTNEESALVERSFGSDPELVSNMVCAQIDGFTRAGVLCAAKHFPGIGDAEGDSHDQSIYSSASKDEMLSWSCVPFKAAIDANVPMIMVGHLVCTSLQEQDAAEEGQEGQEEGEGQVQANMLPASLDPKVIIGMLREELGYGGLVITDSLQMDAATNVCAPDEQAVRAIQAGADLVLMPEDFEKAYNGLLNAVKSGLVSEERIDESVRRVVATKLEIGA